MPWRQLDISSNVYHLIFLNTTFERKKGLNKTFQLERNKECEHSEFKYVQLKTKLIYLNLQETTVKGMNERPDDA